MRSRLVQIGTSVSLLLLAMTLALWVRGYWVRDGIWYNTPAARYSIHSYRGRIWFWTLSGGRAASDSVWSTPTRLHPGWVWDSTPDSYYNREPYRRWRMKREAFTLAAPTMGYSSTAGAADWHALGFRYLRNNTWLPIAQLSMGYPSARSNALFVPHWALVVLFALMPAAVVARNLRRRHRRRQGLCTTCGYDLRATTDRCPECGSPITAPTAPAVA